jgi:hypothetical protein
MRCDGQEGPGAQPRRAASRHSDREPNSASGRAAGGRKPETS